MAAAFDPFEVLGVRPSATPDEIRTAYREQVARYHPDKHRGNPLEDLAAARLVEINRAYEVLADETKRAQFEAVRAGPTRRAPSATRAPAPNPATKLVRSIGLLVTLLLFIRFGLALGGQLLAIVRAVVLGVLWIARANPILALVVACAIAVGVSYARRARKGPEE